MQTAARLPLTSVHANTVTSSLNPLASDLHVSSSAVDVKSARPAAVQSPRSFTMAASQYRRQSSATQNAGGQQQTLGVGDTVEVPGGLSGTVRYIGSVKGKNGEFVGVELGEQDALRGKNDGDVDGIRYFTTSIPGSGIFLPSARAIKVNSPRNLGSTFGAPKTPIVRKIAGHVDTPTPSIPLFAQSLGPDAQSPFSQSLGPRAVRPPSEQSKLRPRPSLPRPASPTRKTSILPLSSRPSIGTLRNTASPFPSRTPKPPTPLPVRAQSRAQTRAGDTTVDDSTPTNIATTRPNPGIRTISNNGTSTEEVKRLRKQLEERDGEFVEFSQQMSEQTNTIQRLQASLSDLQAQLQKQSNKPPSEAPEIARLRAELREKDDKIMALTTEFETHRQNFRETIDALEAASAETERVYSKRVRDLEQEVEELQTNQDEMAAVAEQFTQLESMVQELEEGLDSARRDQSEATSKVEEMEGELERARLELEQERQQASQERENDAREREEAANEWERSALEREEAAAAAVAAAAASSRPSQDPSSTAHLKKELDRKTDEIRGLRAIIQNLSSTPSSSPHNPLTPNTRPATSPPITAALELDRLRIANASLYAELAALRASPGQAAPTSPYSPPSTIAASTPPLPKRTNTAPVTVPSSSSPSSPTSIMRPFPRDHDSLAAFLHSSPATGESRPRTAPSGTRDLSPTPEPESSTDTGNSADLWCEICEQTGHDVLSCRNVLEYDESGTTRDESAERESDEWQDVEQEPRSAISIASIAGLGSENTPRDSDDWTPASRALWSRRAPPSPAPTRYPQPPPITREPTLPNIQPRPDPDPPSNSLPPVPAPMPVVLAVPGETGPAPGKRTGRVDMNKWCAFCERDGHESVDCPFEEEL